MADDEGYDLKWKNYLTDVFGVLRLIRAKDAFSDVILYCDGKQFLAHKVILAACSTFFERMLSALPSEKSKVLVMTDTDSDMLDLLLKFMYTGEAFVDADCLDEFMKTAERLEIRGLRKDADDSRQSRAPSNSRKRPSRAVKGEDDDDDQNGYEAEGGSEENSRDSGDPFAKPKRTKTVPPLLAKKPSPKLPPNVTLVAASSSASNSAQISKPSSSGMQAKREAKEVARPGSSGVQSSNQASAAPQNYDDDIVEIPEDESVKDETQEEYGYGGEEWAEGEGEHYEEGEYYGEEGSEDGVKYNPDDPNSAGGSDERPETIPPEISTAQSDIVLWRPGTHVWKGYTSTGRCLMFCGICGYSSKLSAHVTRHILTHTGARPFVCKICGRGFNQKYNLKTHCATIHNVFLP